MIVDLISLIVCHFFATILFILFSTILFILSESGFGDVDGDGGDGNLSDFAAVSLDTLTKFFEPEEVLQVCMVSAWGLVTQVSTCSTYIF